MSRKFIIIIECGERNCSAYAPDLPGCIATGKTIEETKRNMTEAVKAHLQFMGEAGNPIPEPTAVVADSVTVDDRR